MRRLDRDVRDYLPNPLSRENLRKISGTLILAMIARMLSGGGASPAEAEQAKRLQDALAGDEDSVTQLDPDFLEQLAESFTNVTMTDETQTNRTPPPPEEGTTVEGMSPQESVRNIILEHLAYYVYQPDLGDGRYGTPMLFNTDYEPVQIDALEDDDSLLMIQLADGLFCGAPGVHQPVGLVVINLPEGMDLSQLLDGDAAASARNQDTGLVMVTEVDLQAVVSDVSTSSGGEDLSQTDDHGGLTLASFVPVDAERPVPPDDGDGNGGGDGGTPASQEPVESEPVQQDGGGEDEPLEVAYMSEYVAEHDAVYSEQPLTDNERASFASFLGLDPAGVWEGTKTEVNGKDVLIYRVPNGPALSYGIGPDGWPVELRTNADFLAYVEGEAPAAVEMVSPASITSSELMTTMPEAMGAYLEANFSFFAEDVEGGIAEQEISAYGITIAITNGSAEEIGVPVPAESTERFLLHVRADIAVRMAEQQGIELTREEALEILERGESFGFTGEVKAVPSRALRTIASGGGNAETVEFNPDLPELGGTQVTIVLMKEGFFHDAEPGADRLESRRGLSSGDNKGVQYAITALPDGTVLIPQYRDRPEAGFTEWGQYGLSTAFIRFAYLLASDAPLDNRGERFDLMWNSPEILPSYIFFTEWTGADDAESNPDFDPATVPSWIAFQPQPEPAQ